MKCNNIWIIGVPKGEERQQGIENLFEEIMTENFSYLANDIQVQEAHIVPNKRNSNRHTPRYIIIKMSKLKDKERTLKAARERQLVTYKVIPTRMSTDFSMETLQARRDWQDIFKVMENNRQP